MHVTVVRAWPFDLYGFGNPGGPSTIILHDRCNGLLPSMLAIFPLQYCMTVVTFPLLCIFYSIYRRNTRLEPLMFLSSSLSFLNQLLLFSLWYQSLEAFITSRQMAQSSTSFTLSMCNLHSLITAVSTKLNSKNYLVWRMTFLPLIQNLKLMNHLTHGPPDTTTTDESNKEVPNPKYEEWQSRGLLLRTWIIGTLSEEALGHVVGQNTAREVWGCLEETYLQATKEREVQLKRQLQMPKPELTSLGDYLILFKSICDNLAAIEKPIYDEDKTVQLSHCLGKRYDVFVTTMLSKPPFPTFSQFVIALQGYDMRYGSKTSAKKEGFNSNPNLAFFGQ
jgi:hypothetical protein